MYGSELVPPLCALGTVSLGNRGVKIVPRPSPLESPAGAGIALLLSPEEWRLWPLTGAAGVGWGKEARANGTGMEDAWGSL